MTFDMDTSGTGDGEQSGSGEVLRRGAWIAVTVVGHIGRALLVIAASLVILVLLLFLALQTPAAGRVVAGLIARQVNAFIAGSISAGRLDLDGARVVLRDLVLLDPGGREVLRIPKLVAQWRPLALLRRRVTLSALELYGPVLHLRLRQGGLDLTQALARREPRSGGTTPPQSSSRAGRWAFRLDRLDIAGGRISYAALENGKARELMLGHLTAEGSGQLGPAHSLSARLRLTGNAEWPLSAPLLAEITATGGAAGVTGEARLRVGGMVVAAMKLEELGAVRLDIVRLVAPARLATLLFPAWPLAVPIVARGQVTWGAARPGVLRADLRVTARHGGDEVVVHGSVMPGDWSSPDGIELTVDADAGRLLRHPKLPRLTAALEVAPGPLAPAAVQASLRFHTSRSPLGHASGQATLRRGAGSVRVDAALPGARLRVTGGGALDQARLRAVLAVSSLERLARAGRSVLGTSLPRLAGHGRVELEAGGDLPAGIARLTLAVTARFPEVVIGTAVLGGLRLDARLRPAGGASSLIARMATPHPVTVEVAGRHLPGAAAGLALRLDRVVVAYPARRGSACVRWRSRRPSSLVVGGAREALDSLVLAHAGESLVLSFARAPGGTVRARVRLRGVGIQTLPSWAVPASVLGRVTGDVLLSRRSSHPVVRARLVLRDGALGTWSPIEGTLAARYQRRRASGTLELALPEVLAEGRFDVPARWPMPPAQPVRGSVVVEAHAVPGSDGSAGVVSGSAKAHLSLSGTAQAPVVGLSADVGGLELAASDGHPSFSATGTVEAEYRAGGARLALALEESGGGRIRLEGGARLDLPAALAQPGGPRLGTLPVDGTLTIRRFPSAWLEPLASTIHLARGRIDGTLAIDGTVGAPRLQGAVHWDAGRLLAGPPSAAATAEVGP
jgi:hypothetical protein